MAWACVCILILQQTLEALLAPRDHHALILYTMSMMMMIMMTTIMTIMMMMADDNDDRDKHKQRDMQTSASHSCAYSSSSHCLTTMIQTPQLFQSIQQR